MGMDSIRFCFFAVTLIFTNVSLQRLSGATYLTRDYDIDGEPAKERAVTSLLYGTDRYPELDEIEQKVKDHTFGRFGATRVNVMDSETIE